jgi:hypothetical protein
VLRPENNFFEGHAHTEFVQFHELVVKLILATDMQRHVTILGEFNAALAGTGGGINWANSSDRHLVLRLLIKMADLSNSSRENSVYREWTDRVCAEFWNQGDREKAAGLQISPFMDRSSCDVGKMQRTFLSMVIRPLVTAVIKVAPGASELLANVDANIASWASSPSPTRPTEEPSTTTVPSVRV